MDGRRLLENCQASHTPHCHSQLLLPSLIPARSGVYSLFMGSYRAVAVLRILPPLLYLPITWVSQPRPVTFLSTLSVTSFTARPSGLPSLCYAHVGLHITFLDHRGIKQSRSKTENIYLVKRGLGIRHKLVRKSEISARKEARTQSEIAGRDEGCGRQTALGIGGT